MNIIGHQVLRYGCRTSLLTQWKCFNKVTERIVLKPTIYSKSSYFMNRNYSEQDKYSKRDPYNNLPLYDESKGELIYSGVLTKYIKGIKIFSLSTSLIGAGLQPFVISSMTGDFVSKAGAILGLSAFVFLTPLLMHLITKKYIICIYYNKETKTFTATSFSLFVRKKNHVFKIENVEVPDVPGPFTDIKINGYSVLLDENRFFNKYYYSHIMGYDRPITDFIKKTEKSEEDKQS